MKFITADDFCEIVVDTLANDGLPRGQRVYVIGSRALPISEADPYTQRIKFFAHIVNTKAENGIVETVLDPRMFLIDPNSLQKVGKKEQKKLTERLQEWLDAMNELQEATVN